MIRLGNNSFPEGFTPLIITINISPQILRPIRISTTWKGFPGGSVVKNPPASAGDSGSIPGAGRSPGKGDGYPLQHLAWKISSLQRSLAGWGRKRVGQDLVTLNNNNSHMEARY